MRSRANPTALSQMPKDDLDHDHRGTDNDTEVDGTHREYNSRVATKHHNNDAKAERHGDGRGDNDRAAQVAEEDVLNHKDEEHAKEDVVQNGVSGHRDQIVSIIKGANLHTGWQHLRRVHRLHFSLDALEDLGGLLAPAHQHDSLNDVILFVASGDAEPLRIPQFHLCDIFEQYGDPTRLEEDDVVEIIERVNEPNAPYAGCLYADIKGASPDIQVIVRQDTEHLGKGEAIRA